jgi:hypothetical protein
VIRAKQVKVKLPETALPPPEPPSEIEKEKKKLEDEGFAWRLRAQQPAPIAAVLQPPPAAWQPPPTAWQPQPQQQPWLQWYGDNSRANAPVQYVRLPQV